MTVRFGRSNGRPAPDGQCFNACSPPDPDPIPMSSSHPRNLLDSALGAARVSRFGELVLVVLQGEGAFVAPLREFVAASRWAEMRPWGGSSQRDRQALLARIDTLAARATAPWPTHGSAPNLRALRRQLGALGLETMDYQWPPNLDEPDGPVAQTSEADGPPPPSRPTGRERSRLPAGSCKPVARPVEPWVLPAQAGTAPAQRFTAEFLRRTGRDARR